MLCFKSDNQGFHSWAPICAQSTVAVGVYESSNSDESLITTLDSDDNDDIDIVDHLLDSTDTSADETDDSLDETAESAAFDSDDDDDYNAISALVFGSTNAAVAPTINRELEPEPVGETASDAHQLSDQLPTDLLIDLHALLRKTVLTRRPHTRPSHQQLDNRTAGAYATLREYQRTHLQLLHDDYVHSLCAGVQQMVAQAQLDHQRPRQRDHGAVQYASNSVLWAYADKSIEMLTFPSRHNPLGHKFAVPLSDADTQLRRHCDQLTTERRERAAAFGLAVAFQRPSPTPPSQSPTGVDQFDAANEVPFMHGSLLLFTTNPESFEDLIVATVVECQLVDPSKPVDKPKNAVIRAQYEQKQLRMPPNCRWRPHLEIELLRVYGHRTAVIGVPFLMLEPKQYFDPTAHVHRLVGNLAGAMPFARELLDVCTQPQQPDYLRRRVEATVYQTPTGLRLPLGDREAWPSPQQLGYNASQTDALFHALTTRVAMIQGPPGTGKSFVGRELVRLFLKNTRHRIAVVCQSNQALDQFLVGLNQHTDLCTYNVVARMGSQCTEPERLKGVLEWRAECPNPKIKERMLANVAVSQNTERLHSFLIDMQRSRCTVGAAELSLMFDRLRGTRDKCRALRESVKYEKLRTRRVFAMTASFAARNRQFMDALAAPIGKWASGSEDGRFSPAKTLETVTTIACLLLTLYSHSPPARFHHTVIVEEAGEMLEAHVLAALTAHTQHFIQIGDHHQLRPHCASHLSAALAKLDVSLFERLHNNRLPAVTLNVQHRAHPQLADLIRPSIYARLEDAASTRAHRAVAGMPGRLAFMDHRMPEHRSGTSLANVGEAAAVRGFCAYLLQQGYRCEDIVVLCTYSAQVRQLECPQARGLRTCHGCAIATVDSFQGREARLVLVSLVRNNGAGDVGFMATARRACVALSRAREGVYMFGNLAALAKRSAAWAHVRTRLEAEPFGVGAGALTVRCEQHGNHTMVRMRTSRHMLLLD